MKFRLVQIGRLKRTNGWNLMFGKTFIRSFHWADKEQAQYFLHEMNKTLQKWDDSWSHSKELIQKGKWSKPPKDNYLG
ncbi:MAG: hypothetical protein ACK47F_04105 [Flavobacteriales bacterium]|jgi:hypothetical protein